MTNDTNTAEEAIIEGREDREEQSTNLDPQSRRRAPRAGERLNTHDRIGVIAEMSNDLQGAAAYHNGDNITHKLSQLSDTYHQFTARSWFLGTSINDVGADIRETLKDAASAISPELAGAFMWLVDMVSDDIDTVSHMTSVRGKHSEHIFDREMTPEELFVKTTLENSKDFFNQLEGDDYFDWADYKQTYTGAKGEFVENLKQYAREIENQIYDKPDVLRAGEFGRQTAQELAIQAGQNLGWALNRYKDNVDHDGVVRGADLVTADGQQGNQSYDLRLANKDTQDLAHLINSVFRGSAQHAILEVTPVRIIPEKTNTVEKEGDAPSTPIIIRDNNDSSHPSNDNPSPTPPSGPNSGTEAEFDVRNAQARAASRNAANPTPSQQPTNQSTPTNSQTTEAEYDISSLRRQGPTPQSPTTPTGGNAPATPSSNEDIDRQAVDDQAHQAASAEHQREQQDKALSQEASLHIGVLFENAKITPEDFLSIFENANSIEKFEDTILVGTPTEDGDTEYLSLETFFEQEEANDPEAFEQNLKALAQITLDRELGRTTEQENVQTQTSASYDTQDDSSSNTSDGDDNTPSSQATSQQHFANYIDALEAAKIALGETEYITSEDRKHFRDISDEDKATIRNALENPSDDALLKAFDIVDDPNARIADAQGHNNPDHPSTVALHEHLLTALHELQQHDIALREETQQREASPDAEPHYPDATEIHVSHKGYIREGDYLITDNEGTFLVSHNDGIDEQAFEITPRHANHSLAFALNDDGSISRIADGNHPENNLKVSHNDEQGFEFDITNFDPSTLEDGQYSTSIATEDGAVAFTIDENGITIDNVLGNVENALQFKQGDEIITLESLLEQSTPSPQTQDNTDIASQTTEPQPDATASNAPVSDVETSEPLTENISTDEIPDSPKHVQAIATLEEIGAPALAASIEKRLDAFEQNPNDTAPLHEINDILNNIALDDREKNNAIHDLRDHTRELLQPELDASAILEVPESRVEAHRRNNGELEINTAKLLYGLDFSSDELLQAFNKDGHPDIILDVSDIQTHGEEAQVTFIDQHGKEYTTQIHDFLAEATLNEAENIKQAADELQSQAIQNRVDGIYSETSYSDNEHEEFRQAIDTARAEKSQALFSNASRDLDALLAPSDTAFAVSVDNINEIFGSDLHYDYSTEDGQHILVTTTTNDQGETVNDHTTIDRFLHGKSFELPAREYDQKIEELATLVGQSEVVNDVRQKDNEEAIDSPDATADIASNEVPSQESPSTDIAQEESSATETSEPAELEIEEQQNDQDKPDLGEEELAEDVRQPQAGDPEKDSKSIAEEEALRQTSEYLEASQNENPLSIDLAEYDFSALSGDERLDAIQAKLTEDFSEILTPEEIKQTAQDIDNELTIEALSAQLSGADIPAEIANDDTPPGVSELDSNVLQQAEELIPSSIANEISHVKNDTPPGESHSPSPSSDIASTKPSQERDGRS